MARLTLVFDVAREGNAVADRLRRLLLPYPAHARIVHTVCIPPERYAALAEASAQKLGIGACYLADGLYTHARKLAPGAAPDHEHIRCRKPPDHAFKVLPVYDRHRVRFFIVRTELREHLVPRNAHANRKPGFLAHTPTYLVGRFHGVGTGKAVCYIKPALVYAERLALVGILGIYLAHHRGIFRVSLKVRLNNFKLGAQLPRLPYSHAGLYPGVFCRLILGEHYAVAHLLRAANRKGLSLKLGLIQPLDARVARIYIRMKYHSVHMQHLRLR